MGEDSGNPDLVWEKMLSAYYVCCIIYSNALQTNFIVGANTMRPDQTAPKGAV